jgi:hypothetical protein
MEILVHLTSHLIDDGVWLFDHLGGSVQFEKIRAIAHRHACEIPMLKVSSRIPRSLAVN